MHRISLEEIIRSLMGAWRIFLRDSQGLAFFSADLPAFWKSFWCGVILLPVYLILVLASPHFPAEAFATPARMMAVELTAYILGWVIWPVLMISGCKILQREKYYLRYIVLYNWSQAPMVMLGLIIAALEFNNLLPFPMLAALSIGFLIWRLAVHVFVFKISMKIDFLKAIPFVMGDFFVGQGIWMVKYSLLVD